MKECDFASIGLSLREEVKKRDYTYEVRTCLYSVSTRDLIASFSTSTRISGGEQVLNTSTQFIQKKYLTIGQIEAITEWLRECTHAARWRLTSFTTMVEVRPWGRT
jgi:hypothetical protein